MSKLTIDNLLDALQNPKDITLPNTAETWERIGAGDTFDELGLEPSDLEEFLKEWMENNEYADLI